MKGSLCLLALLIGLTNAQAFDLKHQARGLQCESCHKVATPTKKPKARVCETCHAYDDLAQRSEKKGLVPNPHQSHAGPIKCVLCHHEHKPSESYCVSCHTNGDPRFSFKVP